jgi:hypothetical protein
MKAVLYYTTEQKGRLVEAALLLASESLPAHDGPVVRPMPCSSSLTKLATSNFVVRPM